MMDAEVGSGPVQAGGAAFWPASHSCTIAATDFWDTSGRHPWHSQAFGGQTARTRCRCWLSAGLRTGHILVACVVKYSCDTNIPADYPAAKLHLLTQGRKRAIHMYAASTTHRLCDLLSGTWMELSEQS